jgi:hypothetical protein
LRPVAKLKHDPEKCEAVFPRDNAERVCAEIMRDHNPKRDDNHPNLIAL